MNALKAAKLHPKLVKLTQPELALKLIHRQSTATAPRDPELPELEALTMLLASRAGIETAACGWIRMDESRRAYITRRMEWRRHFPAGAPRLPPAFSARTTEKNTP